MTSNNIAVLMLSISLNLTLYGIEWVDVEHLDDAAHEIYQQHRIKEVPQGGITYRKDNTNRFLATSFAGPCVILAARHRGSGKGFLTHISMFNEIDPLSWMGQKVLDNLKLLVDSIDDSKNPEEDVLDFYIFGGWRCCGFWLTTYSAERFIDAVDNKIKTVGRVYYQHNGCRLAPASLMLDMKTGKFYSYNAVKNPSYREPDFLDRLGMHLRVFGSWIFFGLSET